MSWSGPRGAVPTQLHNGQGWADCFPTALQCYLRNADKLPLVDDVLTQMAAIALVVRGTPDSPSNPDVTLSEASVAFTHYGVAAQWTASWQDTINAPWSIMLVNGAHLAPANYPASWFAGADWPDHFIVSLPYWQGAANWFCDPLNPAQAYCQYDLASVAGGFGGAYILPSTNHGETPPPRWTNTRGSSFGLLSRPQHGSTALAVVPALGMGIDWSARGTDDGGTVWARLQFRNVVGWAPTQYITETS